MRIKSSSAKDAPTILFNYMGTEQDRKEMRAAIRLTREVFMQKAFDKFRGEELSPGPQVQTDDEIDAHIMMAEKIADAIKGKALPTSAAAAWVHPQWETKQR